MSQPRASLWAAEEIDEDLQVDVHLAIGNYGQNGLYDDGPYICSVIASLPLPFPCTAVQPPRIDEATLVAVQHLSGQKKCDSYHSTDKTFNAHFSSSLSFTSIKQFWKTTSQR
jgi:hypothetical protein